MTHYPPRGRRDAGTDPCLGTCGSPTPHQPLSLSKHVSCLMCPIELQRFQGRPRRVGRGLGVWPLGCGGGVAQVGGAHPTESFCVCRAGLRWHQLHLRQFYPPGHRLEMCHGSLRDPLRQRDTLASRWHCVVRRSLRELGLFFSQHLIIWLEKISLWQLFLLLKAFSKILFRRLFFFFLSTENSENQQGAYKPSYAFFEMCILWSYRQMTFLAWSFCFSRSYRKPYVHFVFFLEPAVITFWMPWAVYCYSHGPLLLHFFENSDIFKGLSLALHHSPLSLFPLLQFSLQSPFLLSPFSQVAANDFEYLQTTCFILWASFTPKDSALTPCPTFQVGGEESSVIIPGELLEVGWELSEVFALFKCFG